MIISTCTNHQLHRYLLEHIEVHALYLAIFPTYKIAHLLNETDMISSKLQGAVEYF